MLNTPGPKGTHDRNPLDPFHKTNMIVTGYVFEKNVSLALEVFIEKPKNICGVFNDGTVALKSFRCSLPESDKPLLKSLLYLASTAPCARLGTTTEAVCCALGGILLWIFPERIPRRQL